MFAILDCFDLILQCMLFPGLDYFKFRLKIYYTYDVFFIWMVKGVLKDSGNTFRTMASLVKEPAGFWYLTLMLSFDSNVPNNTIHEGHEGQIFANHDHTLSVSLYSCHESHSSAYPGYSKWWYDQMAEWVVQRSHNKEATKPGVQQPESSSLIISPPQREDRALTSTC